MLDRGPMHFCDEDKRLARPILWEACLCKTVPRQKLLNLALLVSLDDIGQHAGQIAMRFNFV